MPTAPAVPLRLIWRLAISNVINIIPFALVMPLLALELDRQGYSSSMIGLFGLLPFLAVLLVAPSAAHWRGRIGAMRAQHLGLGLDLLGVLICALGTGYAPWAVGVLCIGLGAAVLWGIAEGLLAEHTPIEQLGHQNGLFQTAVGAAFTVGPFLPAALGTGVRGSLWVACGISLASWLPLLGLGTLPAPKPPALRLHQQVGHMLRTAPSFLLIGLLGGIFENGINALGPVQGVHFGLHARAALTVTGVIAVGSLASQYPLGRLADRLSMAWLKGWAMLLLLASCVALPWTAHWLGLIWPLALIWGAAGGALYTLSMIEVGQLFRGSGLVAVATGLMISSYTLGALLGPALAGPAMDAWPDHGLALALGGATLLGLLGHLASAFTRRRQPQ